MGGGDQELGGASILAKGTTFGGQRSGSVTQNEVSVFSPSCISTPLFRMTVATRWRERRQDDCWRRRMSRRRSRRRRRRSGGGGTEGQLSLTATSLQKHYCKRGALQSSKVQAPKFLGGRAPKTSSHTPRRCSRGKIRNRLVAQQGWQKHAYVWASNSAPVAVPLVVWGFLS